MGRPLGEGLRSYYKAKIEELEIQARDKQHNLRRLEAQRNDLNGKGRWYNWRSAWFYITRSTLTLTDLCSAHAEGGAAAPSRARLVCGRGHQSRLLHVFVKQGCCTPEYVFRADCALALT